jgi:folate-binding protein YgfZ
MSDLDFRFTGGKYFLADWGLVKCSGKDYRRFLDGQTTADLKKWTADQGVLTSRLDRSGRIQSYFYALTVDQQDYLLCPKNLLSSLLQDLEKFVIMDDVIFEIVNMNLWLSFGVRQTKPIGATSLKIFGDLVWASLSEPSELKEVSKDKIEFLKTVTGWPSWDEDGLAHKILNETRLNELAIDYKKGCFLGQETVAKIQNNRGAAYYPTLIETAKKILNIDKSDLFAGDEKAGYVFKQFEFESKAYLVVNLSRKYRIENLEVSFRINDLEFTGIVKYYPLIKSLTVAEKALELYERGSQLFQEGQEQEAIALLRLSIEANPSFADAYEALGVIYGRQEKFEEAIQIMNELERIDSASVMAHTNKSLYLMRLGKIEEAEEEKAKATLKSFEMYGREASAKKEKEELEKQSEIERRQREEMFYQVLEIDKFDEIANYGLADIFFKEKKIDQALMHLETTIENHPRYTQAYLLMGKCLELKKDDRAKSIYEKGIEIATKKGELMPANEMQSRLRTLK